MNAFAMTLEQMLFLFLCILIGFALNRGKVLPAESDVVISRLESYVFDSTLEGLTGYVTDEAQGYNVTEYQIREIVDFCRYLFVGFFIRFLRELKNVSVEEVDTEVRHLTDLLAVFVKQSMIHYHEANDV